MDAMMTTTTAEGKKSRTSFGAIEWSVAIAMLTAGGWTAMRTYHHDQVIPQMQQAMISQQEIERQRAERTNEAIAKLQTLVDVTVDANNQEAARMQALYDAISSLRNDTSVMRRDIESVKEDVSELKNRSRE